jgi:hypothetical protein
MSHQPAHLAVHIHPVAHDDDATTTTATITTARQVSLAFEGVSWVNDDLYAFAVLQMLLGGGLSFSVGGPGKGVFTRFYNHILNKCVTTAAHCQRLSYFAPCTARIQSSQLLHHCTVAFVVATPDNLSTRIASLPGQRQYICARALAFTRMFHASPHVLTTTVHN